MRLFVVLSMVLCALFLSVGVPTAATGTCIGAPTDEPNNGVYPGTQNRTWIQAEVWNINGPNSTPSHLHINMCAPDRERLVTPEFPIEIVYFNMPSEASFRNIAMVTSQDDNKNRQLQVINPSNESFECHEVPSGANLCHQWVTFTPDFSELTYEGNTAILFRAFMDNAAGSRSIASIASFTNYVDNGKPLNHFTAGRQDTLGSAQWNTPTGPEYCRSRWNGESFGDIPDEPISNPLTWQGAILKTDNPSPAPNSWALGRDGNAHEDIAAIPIRSGTALGEYTEIVELESGLHKITQRVNCPDDDGNFSGFLSVFIEVN